MGGSQTDFVPAPTKINEVNGQHRKLPQITLCSELSTKGKQSLKGWIQKQLERVHLENCLELKIDSTIVITANSDNEKTTMAITGSIPAEEVNNFKVLKKRLLERVLDIKFEVEICVTEGIFAPDLELYNIYNEKERLFSMGRKGKRLVVLWWDSSSGACLSPLYSLDQFAEKGAIPVGISIDRNFSNFRTFAKMTSSSAAKNQLWCGSGSWNNASTRAFGINKVPICYVLDKNRKVLFCGHPVLDFEKIESVLEETGSVSKATSFGMQSSSSQDFWQEQTEEQQREFISVFKRTLFNLKEIDTIKLVVSSQTTVKHKSHQRSTVMVLKGQRSQLENEEGEIVISHLRNIAGEGSGIQLHIVPST